MYWIRLTGRKHSEGSIIEKDIGLGLDGDSIGGGS